MEKEIKNGDGCAQLIDFIPDKREWVAKDREKGGGNGGYGGVVAEDKLELKLGPPGQDDDSSCLLSLGYISKISKIPGAGAKRGFLDTVDNNREGGFPLKTNGSAEELQQGKACSSPSSASPASMIAAGSNNTSQTRDNGAPIVGWPPVRSFRRNLANSSKTSPESHYGDSKTIPKTESATKKGFFVKINMDGILIGRKVDLKAYNSYEKLSQAVNELFHGLLAAQNGFAAEGNENRIAELAPITGLLDGTGEFRLVYEDDEGDRMLVGDVPWNMFVSTAKRLRVLKTSELSTLSLAATSRKRTATDC